jgi:hypothetical protein
MWYACGNVSSYEMCANRGLGVLGFSVGDLNDMEPIVKDVQEAHRQRGADRRVRQRQHHDHDCGFVKEDGKKARKSMLDAKLNLLAESRVPLPRHVPRIPRAVPYWPALIPDFDADTAEYMINIGAVICGDPDEALAQCQRWASSGADQLVFGTGCATKAETLEMIELMGKHVIPKVDTDPSTAPRASVTRGRADADQGFGAAGGAAARFGEGAPCRLWPAAGSCARGGAKRPQTPPSTMNTTPSTRISGSDSARTLNTMSTSARPRPKNRP